MPVELEDDSRIAEIFAEREEVLKKRLVKFYSCMLSLMMQ